MIIVVEHIALAIGFSKEPDADAARLVDADSDRSVVQELPLIIFVVGIGDRILCRNVERKQSDDASEVVSRNALMMGNRGEHFS